MGRKPIDVSLEKKQFAIANLSEVLRGLGRNKST